MADDNNFGLMVLLGLGGYFLYTKFLAPSPLSGVNTLGGAPAAPGLGASSPVQPAPGSGTSSRSLDQIFQRLTASIAAGGISGLSFDHGVYVGSPAVFNSYLVQAGCGDLTPAMDTLFPAPAAPVTLPQFWSVASAWLAKNSKVSGLGFYGTVFGMRRN